jgi:aspartate-semialdehyde dehydrogenase
MAVVTGPVSKCNVLDFKFRVLSHNTIRGAAGAAILNAELLYKKGLIG